MMKKFIVLAILLVLFLLLLPLNKKHRNAMELPFPELPEGAIVLSYGKITPDTAFYFYTYDYEDGSGLAHMKINGTRHDIGMIFGHSPNYSFDLDGVRYVFTGDGATRDGVSFYEHRKRPWYNEF